MRRVGLECILLGLTGCSAGERSLFVGSPSIEDAHAVIVVVTTGRGTRAFAHDRSPALEDHMELPISNERALIELLAYDRTLEELDLQPGEIDGPQPGEPSLPLPTEDALFALSVASGSIESDWAPAPRSDTVSALRMVDRRCGVISVQSLPVGLLGDVEMAVTLDDGSIVLSANEDARLAVLSSGTVTRTDPIAQLRWVASGAIDVRGRLWIGVGGGVVLAGPPLDPAAFAQATVSPMGQPLTKMIAVEVDGHTELYTLSERGALERFDGSDWHLLYDLQSAFSRSALVRLKNGDILAAKELSTAILRWSRGTLDVIETGPTPVGISSMAEVEGLGVVVANADGQFMLLEDRSLVPLEGSKVVVSVNAILPFRDGFIYAGEAGWVGQYVQGRFCEPFMLATQTAFFLKDLPDGTVFVTGNGDGRTDAVSAAILTIP